MSIKSELAELKRAARLRNSAKVSAAVDILPHMAEGYRPIHEDIVAGNHQFYNLPGGRGSGKSSFISLEIPTQVMADPTGMTNAIVFRRIAGTIRDSVYSQISWALAELGVSHLWRGTVSPMSWEYIPTGAQIIFRGLDDASKLKSIKPRRGSFRLVWFEEFAELPGPNFQRNVLQSVVRGGERFAVFRSFNPPMSANNWANVLIQEPDDKALTLLTNYTMIPPEWLGESFLHEAARLKEVNETAWRHEYMGEPTGSGGAVFPNVVVREITEAEAEGLVYRYQGLDFGWAVDPCCYLLVAYDKRKEEIFLLDEIYQTHMSNKALAEAIHAKGYDRDPARDYRSPVFGTFRPGKAVITADSADPKSISDLNNLDLHVRPCYKKPGCVEYRVKWLQSRRIYIDPRRTPSAYREFIGYNYAQDKDGNFLSQLIDRDNHAIDALAYALDTIIYKGGNVA